MNRHTVCATFVATIGATLALASSSAMAGKPPPPPPTDPCGAAGLDFPAFAYKDRTAASNKPPTIYVSDSSGKCSRALATAATGSVPQPKFSYPVDSSTNTGRVVWKEGSSIVAVDFTVGEGNTVSVQGKRALYLTSGCCALDLSEDGRTVYFSDTETSISKLDVAVPNNPSTSPTVVYTLSDQTWYFAYASVNGNGTRLFATKSGANNTPNDLHAQLVQIDLETATETRLREALGSNPFFPAANKHGEGVAFLEYIEGTNNCTPLVVTDNDGQPLNPAAFATERFGRFLTWVGANVVMEPRASMVRLACADTTSIAQVAPDGTQTVLLTTGYRPDGR